MTAGYLLRILSYYILRVVDYLVMVDIRAIETNILKRFMNITGVLNTPAQ